MRSPVVILSAILLAPLALALAAFFSGIWQGIPDSPQYRDEELGI
jgi:hypothetical protein